jgi:hypothetical protein
MPVVSRMLPMKLGSERFPTVFLLSLVGKVFNPPEEYRTETFNAENGLICRFHQELAMVSEKNQMLKRYFNMRRFP